jgi:tetratricopeptide (TPR) repeat protein
LTALAEVDAAEGDYDGAKALHLKALALRRKLHPGDSLEVAESQVELARIFLAKRHPPHAEPLLLAAVRTREKLLVDGDVRIAEAFTDLGHAVDQLGNPSSAQFVFGRASKIYGRASEESWELAASLVDEAGAQLELGKRAEGEKLLQKVARIERDRCGDEGADLAAALANVGAAALRGASSPTASSDPRACRMSRLAEPRLSYLLQGLSDALTELGYPVRGRELLQKARIARRWAPHPAPLQPDPLPATGDCVPDGGFAEPYRRPCCSGVIAAGTTLCSDPDDWGNTWRSCRHICGSRLVNGCVPPGGITDDLSMTDCCSGLHDGGSIRCLNPADYGITDRTCIMTCR